MTSRELLRRYQAGERVFRDLEIDDAAGDPALRDQVLDGLDVAGSFVTVDLTGARLRGAVLRANVKTCSFDRADLTGADFRGAALDAATFSGATLTGARFEGAGDQGHLFGADELPDVE
jgi:uncharacterized protein YjbI with pentapeptide repeats